MAEQVRGLVEREKVAYQEFVKVLDFTTETIAANLGKETVEASCKKLMEEAERFMPLFRQRSVLEFPDLRKEKEI